MCKGGEDQTNGRHSLFGHTPAPVHLKSRQPFLPNVQPMDFSAKTVRCANWRARLREKSHIDVGLPTEDLAKGHNSPWLTWRSLNRLRTGYTCSKEQQKKWKYYDGDTTQHNRKHGTLVAMLTPDTSLHFG